MTLLVQHQDHAHADAVLADIGRLGETQAGRERVDAIVYAAVRVRVARPEPVEPPNAWLREGGVNCDLTLNYDPREWPSAAHPGSPPSAEVLARLLDEAAERIAAMDAAA